MRLLLVDPPFHSFMHYDQWYFSTSLAQLAAVAHAAGHEVGIYDGDKYFYKDVETRKRSIFLKKQHLYYDNVDNFDYYIWKHFKQVLKDFNPDVLGVSVFTCKLRSALNVLKLVREFNPAIKICVGGAHVTAVPETFSSNVHIDGVFVGYSDATFPEWLANGCPGGIIRGDQSKIDMDNLPHMCREALLFPECYTPRDHSVTTVSRGCVGRCTFCSNSFMWSGKPYFRTSRSIRAEITELIEKWNIECLLVRGDSLSDFPEESKRIARVFEEFGLSWEVNVRWTTLARDLLEHFISCGCKKISVGLESGSDKLLKYMKKGCNKKMIREKAKMTNELGIEWHLFCIVGFPIETVEDMEETMDLVLEIQPSSVSLNSLSPLPGTEVYRSMPGMTPEFASTMNQLYPNCSFSKYVDLETFRSIHAKMLKVFDSYNRRKKENTIKHV